MGNYKFRFSDMMPNAWFYKLRDMSNKKPRSQKVSTHSLTQPLDQKNKTSKRNKINTTFPNSSSSSTSSPSTATTTTTTVSFKPTLPHSHSPRKSYYFTRDYPTSPTKTQIQTQNFPESPRRSSSRNRMRKRRSSSAKQSQKQLSSARTSCSAGLEQEFSLGSSSEKEFCEEREFRCDRILATDATTFDNDNNSVVGLCSCEEEREKWKDDNDIVIDVARGSFVENPGTQKEFDAFAKIELPPITTKLSTQKPKKKEKNSINSLARKNSTTTSSKTITSTDVNNYHSNSPGFRVRINNSPRIANKKVSGLRKSVSSPSPANTRRSKSLSDSLAVVKSSFDPQRDFRESMLEMIIEHNIRASKDLEDLLACYLSLNSDEYHGVIIKVFKQIWFDITDIK